MYDRRALDPGFEFPGQSVAVIDLKAWFGFEDLDPSPARARSILHLYRVETEDDVGLSGQCQPSAPGLVDPGPSRAAGETTIPECRLSRTGQGCNDNSAKSRR